MATGLFLILNVCIVYTLWRKSFNKHIVFMKEGAHKMDANYAQNNYFTQKNHARRYNYQQFHVTLKIFNII